MQADTFLKQILFSTVRIVAEVDSKDPLKLSVGTGFLIGRMISESHQQILLVTNKHVIARTDGTGKVVGKFMKGSFTLLKDENGNPKLGDSVSVNMPNISDSFLLHPDEEVDLAICNVSDAYNDLTQNQKHTIFIRSIPLEMIPKGDEAFDVIEDIVFVGYPNGIFDAKNHLPVVRKGITATPYEVDFNGSKKFLIDAQVFPGSSGSPVFIKESNLKNGALRLGERYFFAGIISKVFQREESGKMTQTTIPTIDSGEVTIRQMIGLGICEKSIQVNELIDLLDKTAKA